MDAREELGRDERAQRAQVRGDAELFEAMLTSPAWARYRVLVEAVAQNYYARAMKPLDSTLEVVQMEYAKGVLAGLTLASSIPTMKIRESTDLRREAPEDE